MSREATRSQMPLASAFIDDLREAFGVIEIDNAIRRGMRQDCQPLQQFFATEGGKAIGTRYIHAGKIVSGCDLMLVLLEPEAVSRSTRKRVA